MGVISPWTEMIAFIAEYSVTEPIVEIWMLVDPISQCMYLYFQESFNIIHGGKFNPHDARLILFAGVPGYYPCIPNGY
jgi:hypothetical protein